MVRSANASRPDQWRWLFFVVFYAILANIPFWFAKHFLSFYHDGWFCVEYAIVGLLALYLPRIVSAVVLFVVIAADMTCAVCETYALLPSECIANFTSLNEFSGARFLALSAVFILTFLLMAIGAWLPVKQIRRDSGGRVVACLLLFIAACTLIDGVTVVRRRGSLPNPFKPAPVMDSNKLSYYGELRLSRRTAIRLLTIYHNESNFNALMQASEKSTVPLRGASAVALDSINLPALKATPGAMPNIVLVLLESWGFSADPSIRDAVVQAYSKPALLARYEMQQGTVAFHGPTMGGEGRELCGDRIGFGLMTASAQSLQSCLPGKLDALGYRSVALHGLDGNMFKRADWYPRIGFEQEFFRDQLLQQGLPQCVGAFTGICDAAIAQWIGQRLAVPDAKPEFVYWMTLNSHLPLPVPAPLKNAAPCSIAPLVMKKTALCSWYQLVANVHASVAQLALTALYRPTVFIIVGDHTPPFADSELRPSFSDSVVPYVILLPHASTATQARP